MKVTTALILGLVTAMYVCASGCGSTDPEPMTEFEEPETGSSTLVDPQETVRVEVLEADPPEREPVAEPETSDPPADPDASPDVPADPLKSANGEPGAAKEPAAEKLAPEKPAAEKLEEQIAGFQVPPDWVASVTTKWDTNKPWSEARQEIRRLLGLNDDNARREGVKLTWDYLQKKDIGDGHEYGMYMFLGHEPLWAIIAFREFVDRPDHNYPPYFGLKALASLYAERGVFEEGERLLLRGLKMRPPKAEWNEMREAEMHDALGDLYVVWGKIDKAKTHYGEAMRLFPLAKPPNGRHLLPRRAKKVQSKLDLLTRASLQDVSLRDGTYRESALGYSGDIKLTVKIAGGRITNVAVQHQEKIDQNACKIVPQTIVETQSLQVDAISGATVTQDAIIGGTLRALRQAGLE